MGEPPHPVTPRDLEQAVEHLRLVTKAAIAGIEHLRMHPDADAREVLWRIKDVRIHADDAETAVTGRRPDPAPWCEPGRSDAENGDPR